VNLLSALDLISVPVLFEAKENSDISWLKNINFVSVMKRMKLP